MLAGIKQGVIAMKDNYCGEGISFQRKVNRDDIPICNILGVNIAAINMDWMLDYLHRNVKSQQGNLLSGDYICVANVHTTVTAYEDLQYRMIQNSGLMAIPDGGPLSKIGKKKGFLSMERTAGPSLMGEIFKASASTGYKHFFYGSTPETLKKLRVQLENEYPGIQIVGMYSPPFRTISIEEDMEIIQSINNVCPDFVWVGLGAPKQEKWMASHQGKINGLMLGVGAGFDYYAGKLKRAPLWMQDNNLEWLYRLLQEPRRLFKRYFITNTKYLWLTKVKGW